MTTTAHVTIAQGSDRGAAFGMLRPVAFGPARTV